MPNNNIPFNRDQFIRTLFYKLRDDAVEFKEKKDSTSNDLLFIGTPPLLYEFFEEHNFFNGQ